MSITMGHKMCPPYSGDQVIQLSDSECSVARIEPSLLLQETSTQPKGLSALLVTINFSNIQAVHPSVTNPACQAFRRLTHQIH